MIGKIILKIFEKGQKKNVRRMKRITLEFKKKKSKGDLNQKKNNAENEQEKQVKKTFTKKRF